MNSKTVITIGRQFGSGGKEIGEKLAKELGIRCYDKELLAVAAKESGLCKELFENHDEKPTNIINMYALQMWGEFGGSGVTIGLVIAIMIFGKREDNKAIATLSLVPGLFNINETVTFGVPMVLNPILGIPFVVAPLITIIIGYVLTVIGFCPVACLTVPWTTPPIVFGFLACGANVMGAVTQAILIVVSTVIYVPFLISYEKYQNKQAAEA